MSRPSISVNAHRAEPTVYCLLPYRHPATGGVRGACGVEDELCAMAVFEGGRAFDGRAAVAERRDYLARKDGEAARPLVVAQALGQRRVFGLDRLPLATADARA